MSLTLLVLAVVLHAGFQVTVTALVYPALVDAARRDPGGWPAVHDHHARRITPVVAVVYLLCLVTGVVVLVGGPHDPLVLAGGALLAATALVTAALAAPLHGRLAGRTGTRPSAELDRLLARLLVVDRVRAVLAVGSAACLVAAYLPTVAT